MNNEFNINFIKEMYNKFKDTNEENIKIHVVSKFLEIVGYNPTEFNYEHPKYHKDGRTDIAVKVGEDKYLYVEVKAPNKKLTEKEQSQLADYLFSSGLEWGILTNGENFILFNRKVEGKPDFNRGINLDRVVFNIDVFNPKQKEYIQYFGKEKLFDKEITNYFRDIAQFKAIKYPNGGNSWNTYKGTLFNFFKYYSEKQNKYRCLAEIRVDEFDDFVKHDEQRKNATKKKVKANDTFATKYFHIRSFFQTLNVIPHGFDENISEFIKRMNVEDKNSGSDEILNNDNIKLILDFYNNGQDATRNKLIFLLCLSFGLERSALLSLTDSSYNKGKIIIKNGELKLPPKLDDLINDLMRQKKKDKIKTDALLYAKYSGKYSPVSQNTINYIFDTLKNIENSNVNFKKLNPAYIRIQLIKQLFSNNYSIEDIVYLTGADLKSLSDIISYENIIDQVKTRGDNFKKVHPFKDFLY